MLDLVTLGATTTFSKIKKKFNHQTFFIGANMTIGWLITRYLARLLNWSQILLFLPLAYDIVSKECFLSLSLSLVVYYSMQATLKLATRRTAFEIIPKTMSFSQLLVLPFLLILCFNIYSSDKLMGAVQFLPYIWERCLRFLSPLFVLFEGIATLLIIQSIGQTTRWFIEYKAESYQFGFLIFSASTYVASCYFVYSVYRIPEVVNSINATLIGSALTFTICLSASAVWMGKGVITEIALLFAYVTYSIYMIQTNSLPAPRHFVPILPKSSYPPLPPFILHSFTAVRQVLSRTFGQSFDFVVAASATVPLPVLIALIYRIIVLYAATRIIPKVRGTPSAPGQDEPSARFLTLLLAYAKPLWIMVYTHLLLDEGSHTVLWRWLNCFATLGLYTVEIVYGREDNDSFTNSWHTD